MANYDVHPSSKFCATVSITSFCVFAPPVKSELFVNLPICNKTCKNPSKTNNNFQERCPSQ